MLISVIMIVHNREQLVSNMIEDVLGQSFKDFEYIIIDNCSIDKSGEIVDRYALIDSRISVKHLSKDICIGAARNVGLYAAKGEYVAFVDDDDRIAEDYLQSLYELTEQGKYDISQCASEESREGIVRSFVQIDKKEILTNREAVCELLQRRKIRAPLPSKLVRRKLFLKFPFREDTVHDDAHVVYKYLADANGVVVDSNVKYMHIRHETNVSSFIDESKRFTKDVIMEYYDVYMCRKEYLESIFPDMEEYLVYNVCSFMISMCDKIEKNKIKDAEQIYKNMLEYIKDKNHYRIIKNYATKRELSILDYLMHEETI